MSNKKSNLSILLGAAFLMATSAIGPGFLTQTSVFTAKFAASFGFVIVTSILLDIGAQINVWRVIAISEKRAQDLANGVLPGLGHFLAGLIVLGGLAFNIGNVAGAGMGLNVLLGISVKLGAALSAAMAIGIFLSQHAGRLMDRFAQVLGIAMIVLTVYVAWASAPPLKDAAIRSILPDVAASDRTAFFMAIVTLVGGTVGGYITFSGGHRLLDAGIKGEGALPEVMRTSITGILVTAVMRTVLFLAALGVVSQGLTLDPANPPASVFQQAAGNLGYRFFGIVLWAAAITSVVGSAYTSVSFLCTLSKTVNDRSRWFIIGFIVFSTMVFLAVGQPVKILIMAGAINGLILPIALAIILIAAHRPKLVGSYRHPLWMTVCGGLVVVAMSVLVSVSFYNVMTVK